MVGKEGGKNQKLGPLPASGPLRIESSKASIKVYVKFRLCRATDKRRDQVRCIADLYSRMTALLKIQKIP